MACFAAVAIPAAQGRSAATSIRALASVTPNEVVPGSSVFALSVKNIGRSPIGSISITRPFSNVRIRRCADLTRAWKATRTQTGCLFERRRSRKRFRRNQTRRFAISGDVLPGSGDQLGDWHVDLSTAPKFKRSKRVRRATGSAPGGLSLTSRMFEISDAVVGTSTTPGSPCPAPKKTAVAHRRVKIQLCGKSYATGTVTPQAARSSLRGTFITEPGTFSSGPIPARSTGIIVLGQFTGALTSDVGANRNLLVTIGAGAGQTSHNTALTGYSTTANHAPVARSDSAGATEDTPKTLAVPGVLANDTDADSDTLTAQLVSGPAHSSSFTLNPNGSFSYTPALNYNGPDSFTYRASDGDATSAPTTVTLTVGAVNDPPVNTVPVAQTTAPDTSLVFLNVNGNVISVGDVDAGSSPVEVTLTVANGTLTLGGANGLMFVAGGNGSSTMTFDGMLADVNAALVGLTYLPSLGYHGPDTLSVTTDDLGHTGGGGPKTDTKTVAITVLGDNAPPVVTVPGAQSIDEDTAKVFSGSSLISVSDPDAGSSPVKITLAAEDGTFSLSGTDGLVFTMGTGIANQEMVFTGSLTDINAALAGMSFLAPRDYTGLTSVDITADDQGYTGSGGAKTDHKSVAITVDAVNDAPVNLLPAGQSVNEDTLLTLSAANGNQLSTSDADAGSSPVKVTLTTGYGNVTLSGTSGLTVTGNGTKTVGLTGALTNVNAALNGLTYLPDGNYNGSDTLTIETDDQGYTGSGGPHTDEDSLDVTINAVNDPPVNTVPGAQTVNTDSFRLFNAANSNLISVADLDAGTDPVQVALGASHGALTLSGVTGLSFSAGDGTKDATMTFSGTLSAVNAALNGLKYEPTTDYDGPETLTVLTDDLGHNGAGGNKTDSDTVAITVVNPPPSAVDHDYSATQAVGNTTFAVGGSPTGPVVSIPGTVLTGATDPDGETIYATAGTSSSIHGGTVTMAADGSFTYLPAAGYTGPDTFTYTVYDAHGPSAPATATVSVQNKVWYVNAANAVTGDGRSTNPFKSLSSLQGASDPDGAGDSIFVYSGTYTGGIPLEASQKLVGQPAGLTVGNLSITGSGTNPTISNATGNAITLADGNTIQGVSVIGPSLVGIFGANVNTGAIGTSGPGSVTIAGTTSNGVSLSGSTAAGTIDFGSTSINVTSGHSVSISGRSAGTLNFGGPITESTGSGILLSSNTGATITFSGGLSIANTALNGFVATGGGTVSVTGSNNTLQTTIGAALNVSNTTIGASGLNFRSISSNGTASGIILNNTGSSGGLTVTGTGSAGTGGTIQNTTNSGIDAAGTSRLNLSYMNLTNNGNAVNEGGIRLTNLSGPTNSISNVAVTGSAEDGIYLSNTTGSLGALTIQNCTISNNSATTGNDGINVLASGTAVVSNITVNNCTFSGNRTIAIRADAGDTSALTSTITNNTITRGTPNFGNQGIEVSGAGNSTHTFTVSGNHVGSVPTSGLTSTGINVFNGSAGTALMRGKVVGNFVQNDPTAAPGVSNGYGIRVFNSNLAQSKVRVTGNVVSGVNTDYGILAESSGTVSAPTTPQGRLDVEVGGNTVGVNPGALDLMRVQGRNFNTVCAKVHDNQLTASVPATFFAIFLRQANSAVVNLDGAPLTLAQQNPLISPASISTTGTIGSALCDFTGVP